MDWIYACIDEPGENIRARALNIYSCIHEERQLTGSLNICQNSSECEKSDKKLNEFDTDLKRAFVE